MGSGNGKTLTGVVAFFDDPEQLVQATAKVRDANYQHFDAYTPYPVHGLEGAQGLKRSPIPYVTFIAGLAGFSLAFILEYWTSAVDWPLIVGGKPFNSWPAFVPIMFECTVLLGGLSTFGALLALSRLPNVKRKIVDPTITRDHFALSIEVPDPVDEDDEKAVARARGFKSFEEREATEFLKKAGAREVRSVYSEGWF